MSEKREISMIKKSRKVSSAKAKQETVLKKLMLIIN